MILMMQGRFPLQRSASSTIGAKVANNVSNGIEFGRSLGGYHIYIYIYLYIYICTYGLFEILDIATMLGIWETIVLLIVEAMTVRKLSKDQATTQQRTA